MAENLDVFNFSLTDEEMKRIFALKRRDGRIANPGGSGALRRGIELGVRVGVGYFGHDDYCRGGAACTQVARGAGTLHGLPNSWRPSFD